MFFVKKEKDKLVVTIEVKLKGWCNEWNVPMHKSDNELFQEIKNKVVDALVNQISTEHFLEINKDLKIKCQEEIFKKIDSEEFSNELKNRCEERFKDKFFDYLDHLTMY